VERGRRARGQEIERRAYDAWERKDWPAAAVALEELARDFPDGPRVATWWFDAALAHKFRRDWPNAHRLGTEAARRAPRGEQDPAFWNLGIAATVLRDWPTARDAWQGYGIQLRPGAGEIVEDFGLTCLRLDPDDAPEVVWARRLCPTRARVVSVPMGAGRRFGEIVLHDGAPNGEREVDGRRYPVFDEILRWQTSPLASFTVLVEAGAPADVDELIERFEGEGLGAEPQSSVDAVCRCCSEGTVHQERRVEAGTQTVWLAVPAEAVAVRLLDAWRAGGLADRGWRDLSPVD
jgi:hypothetical protein